MLYLKDRETINTQWTTMTLAGTGPTLPLTIKEYLITRIKMRIQLSMVWSMEVLIIQEMEVLLELKEISFPAI
jgi:hypothetical protein